jgi:hypothetical protein
LFISCWPEAAIVLMDTHHAPEPPALDPRVGRIVDFVGTTRVGTTRS